MSALFKNLIGKRLLLLGAGSTSSSVPAGYGFLTLGGTDPLVLGGQPLILGTS